MTQVWDNKASLLLIYTFVHGAYRHVPIRFSVGTDPDKKSVSTLLEIGLLVRPTRSSKDKGYCTCTLCYRDFGICWARSRPDAKVGSYGAPVCFRADFAAAAEILMRCTVL
jgi:hypothetical protein